MKEILKEFGEIGAPSMYEITKLVYESKYGSERMYSKEDLVNFMQFIISQESLDNTSSVSKETARYYIEQFNAVAIVLLWIAIAIIRSK